MATALISSEVPGFVGTSSKYEGVKSIATCTAVSVLFGLYLFAASF